MYQRPTKDEYFMGIAEMVSARSTCLRRQYGAVITVEGQIVSTGYNGAPAGVEHCQTCYRETHGVKPGTQYELCCAVHAEQNAIIQAAKHGVRINHGTLYVTGPPCLLCARCIINAGIERVVYLASSRYEAKPLDLMKSVGIELVEMKGE